MYINSGLVYEIGWNRNALKVLGVWPDPDVNYSMGAWRFLFVISMITSYVIVPQTMNISYFRNDINRVISSLASIILAITVTCQLIATWCRKGALREVTSMVFEDWKQIKSELQYRQMLTIAKETRWLSVWCIFMSGNTSLSFIVIHLPIFLRTLTHGGHHLAYGFGQLYNVRKSPNYEITFFCQIFGAVSIAFTYTSITNFIVILIMHICGQFVNLREILKNLVKDGASVSMENRKKFKEGLLFVIKRHEHLNRAAKIISDSYEEVLLIQILGATFHLCLQVFRIYMCMIDENYGFLSSKMYFLSAYVGHVVIHLYLFSYASERLLTESSKIGHSAYECKWYNLSPNDAKSLMLIVYRSTVPLRLKAGKFNSFSMETFGAAVKTSMGYLSVLLTIKD